MKITICGGGREVTGANYLIETKNSKFLVDCGMSQGSSFAEKKNYEPFSYNPSEIDFVVLTHSHIDHIGKIPKLYKDGFRGKIYSTFPVRDFAEIFLLDTANLIKKPAEKLEQEPLYDEEDVRKVMELFNPIEYHAETNPTTDVKINLKDAGHILGSAIIEIWTEGKKLVFSGDLGNPPTPLLKPTEYLDDGDYLFIESAYGNRLHEARNERKLILERSVEDAVTRGGTILIPSFAMERTQELLFELNELVENSRIPKIPVFIDSPLAIKATDIYKRYQEYYSKGATYLLASGDEIFKFPGLKITETVEESKKINLITPPKIIIAGAGMMTGGRILHHAIRYLPDPKNMILIVGYQAVGSIGRQLLDGAEEVRIHSEFVKVKSEIRAIGGYSAHADQNGLLKFVSSMRNTLKKVFVVQGEEASSETLALAIKDRLGIAAEAPDDGQSYEL